MNGRSFLIVAGLCALALVGWSRSRPMDMRSVRAAVGDEPVVLLAASWCGYCRKLRGDLAAWGVRYTELDIENDPSGARAFRLLRARGVPVTLVGERHFPGYQPAQIRQAIADAGLLPAAGN